MPNGSVVEWSVSNPYIASLTTSNNIATLTYLNPGHITLTATVSSCCYPTPLTTSYNVMVGVPNDAYSVTGATPVYAGAGYYYSLEGYSLVPATNIVWRVPSGWTIVNGQGTSQILVWTGSKGGAVEVDFDDYCGTRRGKYMNVTIGQGGPQPLKTTPPPVKE